MKHTNHSSHDIVVQTAAYLECSFKLVFTFAIIYQKHVPTRELVDHELERWNRTNKVPDHVEQFCLDLLTGKARVDMDIRKTEWHVVKVKKKEPKRLEQK